MSRFRFATALIAVLALHRLQRVGQYRPQQPHA